MAEETEVPDTGAEASGAGVDPFAAAMALGGASRDRADAFLKKQEALIDDQRHHLREQFKRLKIGVISDRLSITLKVLTGIVGFAAAAGVALMVWNASSSSGLLIEPFAVPPDMAERGFTGEVVATQLLARLVEMQNATGSNRPARSYANNWGDNLKVEIPETGVSIGEAYKFLRQQLGHDTRIGGEITRAGGGIAVTARSEGIGATFSGPEADFDALLQKAAEDVYGRTQPYRYAAFLRSTGRYDEAYAIWSQMSEDNSPLEQAWAWAGVSTVYTFRNNDYANAIPALHKAIAAYPTFTLGWSLLGNDENNSGHTEAALAAYREAARLFARSSIPDLDPSVIPSLKVRNNAPLARLEGDYTTAASLYCDGLGLQLPDSSDRDNFRQNLAFALLGQHDLSGALAYWRTMPPPNAASRASRAGQQARVDLLAAVERQDWKGIVAGQAEQKKSYLATVTPGSLGTGYARLYQPIYALAKAEIGDKAGAEAEIGAMPLNCYECMRAHASVASAEKDWPRANWWFAHAIGFAPSSPFAYEDWGRALLGRGNPDAAIAQFTLANQKGPHFADPLEGWGEALMKKNQSHLALAKFAEAEKYAPNWGRLHLKWGEALTYAGKKDEAQKQYAISAGLDLSNEDKAELAKVSHG